jgi:hypothetical protein
VLGIVMPAPTDAGLNPDDKGYKKLRWSKVKQIFAILCYVLSENATVRFSICLTPSSELFTAYFYCWDIEI